MAELVFDINQKFILHWNCRGFSQLPIQLKEADNIEEIYLKWNNLSSLPSWISRLKNLTNLYLPHNLLNNLPEELSELTKLNVLDVTDNKIRTLPPGLGRLSCLTHFLVAHNMLSWIPNDFQELRSLQVLDISHNNLTRFPEVILECHSLQELILDNNNLATLPDNIVYLPQLAALSVRGNNLLYLPFQPFLSNPSLNFENNPNLNYISIWLGEQISSRSPQNPSDQSWTLTGAQGCFQIIRDPSSANIGDIIVCDDSSQMKQVLTLPSSLEKIVSGSACHGSVPSLLELALRKVYSLSCCHTVKSTEMRKETALIIQRNFPLNQHYLSLPQSLRRRLKVGPVTFCYFCHEFIFNFGVIWIFLKDCYCESEQALHAFYVKSVVVFCSVTCSMSYAHWERQTIMPNKLEPKRLQWFHATKNEILNL